MHFMPVIVRLTVLPVIVSLLGVVSVFAASVWQPPANKATQWLLTQQNPDGSWGRLDEQFLVTSEVVRALAAFQQKSAAYYAGIAWLVNHAPLSTDHQARAILALKPQGELITTNTAFLQSTQNLTTPGNGGWGISNAYQGSAPDTALALEAGNLAGGIGNATSAIAYLKATQMIGNGNQGWAVGSNTTSDPVATASVVQALVPYRAADATLATPIANAVATLSTQVTTASPVATQAQTALALLRDNVNSAAAMTLLSHLTSVQGASGDFNGDIFTTALTLRALSAAQQSDLASLSQRVDVLDQNLRAAINDALGRDAIDALTRGDLAQLTTLNASNRGIKDLTGLQYATNLLVLDVSNNQIASFSPIAGLTNTSINENGNPGYVSQPQDTDVPTLPEWGVILFATLLMLTVVARSRRIPGDTT